MEVGSWSEMTEHTLWGEIVRLQRMQLDPSLWKSVEEAAELLTEGRFIEAQALVENAEARARLAATAALASS